MEFNFQDIGIIHSPFKRKEECPIQGVADLSTEGVVEVHAEFVDALETIEMFSHLYLFYIFDRAGEVILSRPPFLDDINHGVFASRHPCRPNSLGMSVVKLERREGNNLFVSGIDVLDKTPLIDIKPYVPKFDYRENANNGWLELRQMRDKPEGRE